MVATATRALLENLDRIPDDDKITKVGIICYDVSLYFFSMAVSRLPTETIIRFKYRCSPEARTPVCSLCRISTTSSFLSPPTSS